MQKFVNYKVMVVVADEETLHVREGYDSIEVILVDGRVYEGELHKAGTKDFQITKNDDETLVITTEDVVEIKIIK